MAKIKTDKAIIKDAPKIGQIAYQVALLHYQYTTKEFKKPTLKKETDYICKCIADKNISVIKAQIDDEIVGYVIIYFNTYPTQYFQFHKRAFIGSIGVDKNYQKHGVGKTLLKAVENEVKKRKISTIEVDYYIFNIAAENLYKSNGYKEKKRYMHKFV